MIVLNTFWTKDYLHKGSKNGPQRYWVGNLKSFTKIGKKNVVVDVMLRRNDDVEAFLCAIFIIQPNCIIEARDEWKNYKEEWKVIQKS